MKNAKKVLAMVIVLALAISMAIPAMAANSIIIDNAKTGASYSAYKMADLTKNGDAYAYSIAAGSPWLKLFQDNSGNGKIFNLVPTNNGLEYIITANDGIQNNSDAMKQFAIDAVAYAKAKGIAATKTSNTIEDGKVTLSDLAEGYYCVDSAQGTVCIVDTAHDDGNVEITEKNEVPTLEKYVDGDKKVYDTNIDGEVVYTIKVNVAYGAEGYKVVDVLPAGVTFGAITGVKVLRAGSEVDVDGVDVTGTPADFQIVNEEKCNVGDVIVFTYTAVVNDSALVDEANVNSATLWYGEGSAFKSNTDSAKVYTWSLDLVKYANGNVGNLLADATFEIRATAGGSALTFKFDDEDADGIFDDGDRYVYDVDGTVTSFTTNGNVPLKFDGLDQGTYFFVETAAPQGYNKLPSAVEVSIASDGTDSLTATYTGTAGTQDNDVQIENKSGVELPSTGGTGTVIFVTVGSILVLAMGVLLVVRKRMSKVVYTR